MRLADVGLGNFAKERETFVALYFTLVHVWSLLPTIVTSLGPKCRGGSVSRIEV